MKKPEPVPALNLESLDFQSIINNELYIKKLTDIDKQYPYWDEFKYKVKEIPLKAESLWKFIRFRRNFNIQYLTINQQHFKYNIIDSIAEKLHIFDLNLGGVLESESIIPTENKQKLLISTLMEEAIASSQIEGAVMTREMAKEMLRINKKPSTYHERMIVNNYVTIRKIVDEYSRKPLSPELILEIHASMTKDTLSDKGNEGAFRKTNDVDVVDSLTNEVFYSPPSHYLLKDWIKDVCDFINNDNTKFIHPIIKGIILHFMIGYIHPFADGNGRTGRALFYWYLIRKNYWLMEYTSISRIILKSNAQYARAYLHTEYDNNDLTYFIKYNVDVLEKAFKELKEYIARKATENKTKHQIYIRTGINERQADIIVFFIQNPNSHLSVKSVEEMYDVAQHTARTDLVELEKEGYLQSKKIGNKVIFYRSGLFEMKISSI